jgi:hypothetical protein
MTDLPIVGDFSPDFGPELAPPTEEPRWCADCGGLKTFLVIEQCDAGRIGVCQGCEQVKFLPWERTNSEAA